MNDEELRAFLDSATVGDTDETPSPEVEAPAEPVAEPTAPDAQSAPRRGVPSFAELMNMGAPAEQSPAEAPGSAPIGESGHASKPHPFASEAPESADLTPPAVQSVPQDSPAQPAVPVQPSAPAPHSSPAAQEELVPLILPGFSPEPRARQDLPPVFRTEPVAEPASAGQSFDEPAPTQPFDVLSDQASGTAGAPAGGSAASAAAASAPAAAVAASSGNPGAFPAAASRPAATRPNDTVTSENDNPFALLSQDLVSSETEIEYDESYEPIAVTGGESRGRKAVPWIIVGGGAIIALVASMFVINGVRGDDNSTATPPPTTTTEPAPTTEPTTKPVEPEEEEPANPHEAPVVDPGSTWTLRIGQWNMAVEVSEKLGGSTPYTLFDGDTRAMFDSLPVAAGISDACAVAKAESAWGLLKREDGKLEVIRPEPRCTDPADAAVYDTIWGVLDYMAKSAKPA